MKPAITFNGKPIKYKAVTYSKGFTCQLVVGELVEVEDDTSPLIPATTKQQLIDADTLSSIKKRLLKNDGRETAEYLNAMRPLFNTKES